MGLADEAALGGSAALLLKPCYFASSALFGLNVGGSTSGKSPALDTCVGPLWRIDEGLHEAFRAASPAHEPARGIASVAGWSPRSSASNRPTMQSAVLDESTVEAVARLLAPNPRGLLVSRDDASAWVASLGQGQRGPEALTGLRRPPRVVAPSIRPSPRKLGEMGDHDSIPRI